MSLFKALLILHVCMAALSPVWAQAAFDDADAQLRVRQAATAASEAARKVEAARKALETERQRVVATDGERDLNRATIKALEQELQSAEAKQREQDAALRAAQDARVRGLAAEAERRRIEDGQRPQAPARPAPTAPPPPPSPSPAVTTEAKELAAWNTIAASTNPAMFEIFIRQFPNSVFAPFARARLDELKAPGAGDAARRAEAEAEARRARVEEQNKKAEEAKAKAADAARRAEAEAEALRAKVEEQNKKAEGAKAKAATTVPVPTLPTTPASEQEFASKTLELLGFGSMGPTCSNGMSLEIRIFSNGIAANIGGSWRKFDADAAGKISRTFEAQGTRQSMSGNIKSHTIDYYPDVRKNCIYRGTF